MDEKPTKLTRRRLIRGGVLGGGILAAGGGGWLALRKGVSATVPAEELQVLLPSTYPVLVAFAEAAIPPDLVTPGQVAMSVDRRLSYALPSVQAEFNEGLIILENGLAGLFTRGSATPFSLLSIDERAQGLRAWRDSRVALLNKAYHGIRKLVLGAYYAQAASNRRSGYPGVLFEKPDPGPLSERGPISVAYVISGHGAAPAQAPHEDEH